MKTVFLKKKKMVIVIKINFTKTKKNVGSVEKRDIFGRIAQLYKKGKTRVGRISWGKFGL